MKIQEEDGMQIHKYRDENTGGGWDANTDADWGKLGSGATGLRTSLLDNFAFSIIRDYCQIKVSLQFKLLVKFVGNISTRGGSRTKLYFSVKCSRYFYHGNGVADVWIQLTLWNQKGLNVAYLRRSHLYCNKHDKQIHYNNCECCPVDHS